MKLAQANTQAIAAPSIRSSPRAIVTRPAEQAELWVSELQAWGVDAVALPLIRIVAVSDPAALVASWRTLAQYDAVMFVSGNAAAHFFAQRPAEISNPFSDPACALRAWVTGPASQRALQACGVPSASIGAPSLGEAQFDSEALWRAVGATVVPGVRVLIVRGQAASAQTAMSPAPASNGLGRDWFAQQVLAAGGVVDYVVAYERRAPQWDSAQAAWIAQAASDGSVWLLSSAQAVTDLDSSLPGQDWAKAQAVATHPRIAHAARQLGFGRVRVTRPLLEEIVASIESGA